MNILPLIFVFLTILSVASYSFLQEGISSSKSAYSYRGYMRAERLGRNRLESDRYKKISLPKDPNKLGKPRSQKDHFVSHRYDCPPTEASRLNITLLFSENPPPFLSATVANLIVKLYGHTTFFKEANHPDLGQYVVSCLQRARKPTSFAAIFESDPLYFPVLYKMIKGTNHYQLQPKIGYPPLEDFLTLSTETGKICLQLPYTSAPILNSLWGEEITEAIIAAERKKWEANHETRTLIETEFTLLLQNITKPSLQIGSLKDNLSFHLKRPKLDKVKNTDASTHITIRKPRN